MDDLERAREISRLLKMRSKLKNAHPRIRVQVEGRIDELINETALRFLEVFGPAHPVTENLKSLTTKR